MIRPFRRADRDQLTALVNAHAQAVVPGVSVPVIEATPKPDATSGVEPPP